MDNNLAIRIDNLQDINETQIADNISSRLPVLMRAIGAIALAIGMYTFLMKGWQQGGDIERYLMMLAHTAILLTAGLLSGRWLHESKGARLLVVMALASVPANFAILGGFLYTQIQPDSLQDYPRFVTWSMDSLPLALGVTALAMAILITVAKLGFSVLARQQSTPLTALFMASNIAILLPVRDTFLVSALILALATTHALFNQKIYKKDIVSKTFEGLIALTLQYLPVAVLLGRSVWLYHSSFFITFSGIVFGYSVLRRLSLILPDNIVWRPLLDMISAVTALMIGTLALPGMHYSDSLNTVATQPLCMLTAAAMLYELSIRASAGNALFRSVATVMFAGYFIVNLATLDNVFSAQLCLLGGVAMLYMGQNQQQRSVFTSGAVMVMVGLAYNLLQVYHSFSLGGWITLATLGIGLIVLASWIETRGDALKPALNRWKAQYKAWDY